MTDKSTSTPRSSHAAAPVAPQGRRGTGDGVLDTSADRLRLESLRFLRRFGLLSAAWSVLLAVTVPAVADPTTMWAGVGLAASWAVVSQFVDNPRGWWAGWIVTAVALEWTGPLAGTQGWSLSGGAVLIVLFGVVLSGRRRYVAAATVLLVAAGLVRPLLGYGWPTSRAVNTAMFIIFGAVALTWLIRGIERVVVDRDRLQMQLLDARTTAARATERAEAGARLHDTVLQHLTAVAHTTDVASARRHAGRASNELRQFLRTDLEDDGSLRQQLQAAVTRAADGVDISVSVAGDRTADERDRLVVAATAEAVRNAVRHGQPPVRVHAELPRPDRGDTVVWIVDQGQGFDVHEIPEDRLGVRASIIGRMERAGGSAQLVVDGTTEWELRLPQSGGADVPTQVVPPTPPPG